MSVTPFMYLLDHEGRVVIRGVANNWPQIEALLEEEGSLQLSPWSALAEPVATEPAYHQRPPFTISHIPLDVENVVTSLVTA